MGEAEAAVMLSGEGERVFKKKQPVATGCLF
jgi:hypothetical protein